MSYRPSIIAALLALLATPASAGNVIDPYTLFPPTGGGAAPVIATVATGTDASPGNGVTVTAPSGLAENETVFLLIADGNGWSGQVNGPTVPDGSWSLLHGQKQWYYAREYTYWQVAGAGEGSTWTFGGLQDATSATFSALRITGAATTAPIDASAIAAGSTNTVVCPSVTTTGPNRLILTAVNAGNEAENATITALDTTVASGAVRYGEWTIESRTQANAGASGTFTYTTGGTTTRAWICVTAAIKP